MDYEYSENLFGHGGAVWVFSFGGRGRALRQAQRPALESRLRELIGKETGCELLFEAKVDPSLIGGFVFEVEDMILDASVSRQLDVIRHQFIEKNRRIV